METWRKLYAQLIEMLCVSTEAEQNKHKVNEQ